MSKVIIVYTSMTGNTEAMATAVQDGIKSVHVDVEMKDGLNIMPDELDEFDGIILGSYSWGDGDIPDDFLDFYEEMDNVDFTGKKAAVFGSCDSSYESFGGAVDKLIEKLQERGAEVVLEGLKVELTPNDDEIKECEEFGRKFIEKLKGN